MTYTKRSTYQWLLAIVTVLTLIFLLRFQLEAADGASVTVTNQSHSTICKLYITPDLNQGLTGERLGSSVMKHWARRAFAVDPGRYDLLALDCNDNEIARWIGVDLTQTQMWIVSRTAVITSSASNNNAANTNNNNDRDWDGIVDWEDDCADEKENRNGIFDGDGCPDTVDDLLDYASNDIDNYWRQVFINSNITYRPPNRVIYDWRADFLAYYEWHTHSIAISRSFATQSVEEIGDFAPVVALAHEWGHLIQANLDMLGKGYRTKQLELQADCFAGAYTRNAQARNILDSTDSQEGARLLIGLGDDLPTDHPFAHGTGEERAAAYDLGFKSGPRACVQFLER